MLGIHGKERAFCMFVQPGGSLAVHDAGQVDGAADEASQSSARSASHATEKRGRGRALRRRGSSKPANSNLGSLNLQSSQPSPHQAHSQLQPSQSQVSDAAADNTRRAAAMQQGDTAQSGARSNNNKMKEKRVQQAAQRAGQNSSQPSMLQPAGVASSRGVRAPFRPPRQSSAELQQGRTADAAGGRVQASAGLATDADAIVKRKLSGNEALLRCAVKQVGCQNAMASVVRCRNMPTPHLQLRGLVVWSPLNRGRHCLTDEQNPAVDGWPVWNVSQRCSLL